MDIDMDMYGMCALCLVYKLAVFGRWKILNRTKWGLGERFVFAMRFMHCVLNAQRGFMRKFLLAMLSLCEAHGNNGMGLIGWLVRQCKMLASSSNDLIAHCLQNGFFYEFIDTLAVYSGDSVLLEYMSLEKCKVFVSWACRDIA